LTPTRAPVKVAKLKLTGGPAAGAEEAPQEESAQNKKVPKLLFEASETDRAVAAGATGSIETPKKVGTLTAMDVGREENNT